MATITVKLSRGDNTPWGFRLQGGKDFGSPIAIQRVNPNSLADQGGLQPGDMILTINNNNADLLRHKEAQDCIVRAGNSLELSVQRGGMRIWKPSVTPVGDLKGPTSTPMTKTSLAANKQDSQPIGSSHNVQPKPFSSVPSVVNRQYNSPVNIYSMQSITEALTAQTEVLATGAMGINFMKEDKPVNKGSAVYQLVHQGEEDGHKEPSTPPAMKHVVPPQMKHVPAPVPLPPSQKPVDPNASLCSDCGRLIVGVFVRIKDKSLHAECFKCSTCGTSLKNQGYYNVNEKLYCDIHAKQAASLMPAPAHLEPVTIPPGGGLPFNTPIASVGLPPSLPMAGPKSPGTSAPFTNISPVPFHRAAGEVHHVNAPVSPQPLSSTCPPSFAPATAPAPILAPLPAPPAAPQFSEPQEVAPLPATNGFVMENQAPKVTTPVIPPLAMPHMAPHAPSAYGHHPQTAPASDAHRHVQGGSKFVWPPPKGSPQPQLAQPTFESNASPALPTYRPPPGTQHINFTPTTPTTPKVAPSLPTPTSGMPKIPPSPAPKPRPPAQSSGGGSTPAAATPQPSWSTPTPANAPPGGISPMSGSRPAPRRGRGQLKQQPSPGTRIPICADCGSPIRGPFIVALGKTWCPDHFLCKNSRCRRPLADVGFVEEQGQLYCETCWEAYLAPTCCKCNNRIKGDCLNALDKQWHPECFVCAFCRKPFGNSSFYLEDGQPYCEKDWNEMFTTKCVGCGFPIEAGDRWVEALSNNYHSQCFKCTICQKNLEGQSFYAKGGRPFCKAHAR